MFSIAKAARRRIGVVAWRQWLTVLVGAAVVVAMVLVAETARRDSERHQRAQVLVERVRAQGQQVGALDWHAIAVLARRNGRRTISGDLVKQGLATWTALSGALADLRTAEPGATATRLQRDALGLYSGGQSTLTLFLGGDVKDALALNETVVQPQLSRLDADAHRAAARQQTIASQASRRAAELYVGSLLVGLLLLFLVGWRLHRQRRIASLAGAQLALERRSEQRLRALVEHSSDVISVLGRDLRVRWQSPSLSRMLGFEPERALGRRAVDLVHPEDAPEVERLLTAAGHRSGTVTLSTRVRHANSEWRHLEVIADNRLDDPAVEGIVLSMRDVTARQALEEELRHQAFHDALTGLANRALFEEHVVHALARSRRTHQPAAILFLDLDDFKTINDSLGHEAGDELLRAVAVRIASTVRAEDTAARLGGDEFAVLVEPPDDENDARPIATRLLAALAEPFDVAGRELRVSASVGLAWSDGSVGIRELMRDADTAMYAAKDAGKNTVRTFETGMHRRVVDRFELTGELQQAIEQEQFELEYQPVVNLQTGDIYGVEALVRWAHPTRGRVAPAEFIPLAEETGLIVPLGEWILRTACEHASRLNRELPHRPPVTIGVNVSTRQLHDPLFPELIRDVLASTGVAPESLALEITESLLPEDGGTVIERLAEIAALGVHIAVDDFGTGYSALSRLHHFPIDTVKIDRSFITGIERDANKAQLVQGIVSLAESLNLVVVAEGIEHPAQADQLRGMRAHYGQGYLYSRPVAPGRLLSLLQDPDALAVAA
ncbi:MAG TPA: EAL domain-containing protein [Solirubrobacteraceae bacterium]|nr:EAL domain-containing protein [Solirubrobacteraceae bacterium]